MSEGNVRHLSRHIKEMQAQTVTIDAPMEIHPLVVDLIRREVARTLYALLRSDEANVVEMSEDEFVAFCERVMSEGK